MRLEFTTVQGARACGLEAKTGSLTPGKEADIVLIETDSLRRRPQAASVGGDLVSRRFRRPDRIAPQGPMHRGWGSRRAVLLAMR
jgi:cytosine/adenosine deaminase-related metal-dependent hydrolase